MILNNQYESFNTPSMLVNNKQPRRSGSENLWKQALEKNDLYVAIGKFEVIKSKQGQDLVINKNTYKEIPKIESNQSDVFNFKEDGSSNKLEKSQVDTSTKSSLINLSDKSTFHKTGLNQTFYYQSFITKAANTSESIQTKTVLRAIASDLKWQDKNAHVTVANSTLEIWIRDSGITNERLSEVLKSIRYSMADLGASLSKVTVNGKAVFFREK